MTLEHIKEAIDHIRENAAYDEHAHHDEDDLHKAVLAAIADGTFEGDEAKEASALALRTQEIVFARWYA